MNQKPISARIFHTTLWEMEQEKMVSGRTRNSILNEGARLYLFLLDLRRSYSAIDDPEARKKMIRGFFKIWLPEVQDF